MVTAEELPERLAALLSARGVAVRPESNHAYAVDGSAFPAIWETFKAALAEPVQDADWEVASVHAGLQGPYGRHGPEAQVHALEFTRLADDGDGDGDGLILVAEWTPSGAAFAVDAGAGAAGASEPDETSVPLDDWIAAVEASEAFRTVARRARQRIVFAPEETGD
jgi:hypothetical protein